MNRVFITGVSGFAGKTLVHSLQGAEDVMLWGHSRYPEETSAVFAGVPVRVVGEWSAEIFDTHAIDTVIHLAGIAHDLSNRYREEDYYRVNYENTRALYDEFLRSRATRFIFVSSIKAVADEGEEPVTELAVPMPVTVYGKSKRKAEEYILSHLPSGERRVYILRPCMIHGPGNKGNLNLLYKFVSAGLPYPLGAFRNRRSFLSADNFSFIIGRLIRKQVASGVYHLADDGTMSTVALVRLIGEVCGRSARIWNVPPWLIRSLFLFYGRHKLRKLTESMVVSNALLKEALQEPLPVGVEEGIRRTVAGMGE